MRFFLKVFVGALWFVIQIYPFDSVIADSQTAEVFVGGKKFSSIEHYRKLRKQDELFKTLQVEKESEINQAQYASGGSNELHNLFLEARARSKNPLDMSFDPRKVKTMIFKNPTSHESTAVNNQEFENHEHFYNPLPDPYGKSYQFLNTMSVNTSVNRVVEDFLSDRQSLGTLNYSTGNDLEKIFEEKLSRHPYRGPLLLMSDQKKLRIMKLDDTHPDMILEP